MRVSSGVTSYLYDVHRQAAQRRGSDDVASEAQKSRLLEGKRAEPIHAPVEQVVEGEVLDGHHDTQVENIFRFNQARHYDAEPETQQSFTMGAKAGYALSQYQIHGVDEDRGSASSRGQQIDYYV